jgi:hypothetical protein
VAKTRNRQQAVRHGREVSAVFFAVGLLGAGLGCGGAPDEGLYGDGFLPVDLPPDGGAPAAGVVGDPGVVVELRTSAPVLDALREQLSLARSQDAVTLRSQRELPFASELGYSAVSASGLELLQASALSITPEEMVALGQRGFVILPRREYPSFAYAYTEIYSQDLPVFVSADMVLEAVHRSYDQLLETIERLVLVPRFTSLLSRLRARLGSDFPAQDQLAADLDLLLSVGQSLLDGSPAAPARGASASQIEELVAAAQTASGIREVSLFGVPRQLDFSQFAPRGHYTGDPLLERYFRAMMWFGRTDLRLIETLDNGNRVFRRRQLEAALGLSELLDVEGLGHWTAIDSVLGAFVGEHDYMTLLELGPLLAALGVSNRSGLAALPDARIAQAITDGQFGDQRIASQVLIRQDADGTLPLDRSFALFGQRYLVDSHVFSNVVFDRVPGRVLPSSLDVAFAALGNDHALSLIGPELDQAGYPGALSALRTLITSHQQEYWESSLYTSWLGALRMLSPGAPGNTLSDASLPALARSELWSRRLLNTQLASWAQLRHDTVLYAKQSYTAGSLCEFPDAYVDPYPEFFRALARFAELGQRTVAGLGVSDNDPELGQYVLDYFTRLGGVMDRLGRMAEAERTGAPHAAEDIAFINQAVALEAGCGGFAGQTGWYRDLFFRPETSIEESSTIADVHTDPGGQLPVSRGPSVLHVGTGRPRLMVLAVDSCSGPRAYVGAVFDYQERVNPGLKRFNDEEWGALVAQGVRWEPGWMQPAFAPE